MGEGRKGEEGGGEMGDGGGRGEKMESRGQRSRNGRDKL